MRIRFPKSGTLPGFSPDSCIIPIRDLIFKNTDGDRRVIKYGSYMAWFEIEGDEDHIALKESDNLERDFYEAEGVVMIISKEFAIDNFRKP